MDKAVDYAGQVARRIKQLREANGLSLRELARRSGLSPESVSRSERGVTEITLTNLGKLCRGLGVDLSAFFEFSKAPADNSPDPVEVRRLSSLLRGLPRDRQRTAARSFEFLIRTLSK